MYTASACVGGVQSAIARSAGASQSSAGRASQSQAVAGSRVAVASQCTMFLLMRCVRVVRLVRDERLLLVPR